MALIQLAIFCVIFSGLCAAQSNDNLRLQGVYLDFSTVDWDIKLVKDSQVLASLKPPGETFDFSPFDYLDQRDANGNYHTGDITLRYRAGNNLSWIDVNSATERSSVLAEDRNGGFARANLGPTLLGLRDLNITRSWSNIDGDLAMIFNISNILSGTVEIGSLGFPIEFNSIFTNRDAKSFQANCSFQDPYIGLHAGYVQVTKINGVGPSLVVTPMNESKLEAWRFLPEDNNTSLLYHSQTFEGFYEFQVYTKAYAENEWKNVTPWNVPTSRLLNPGETMTAGLRFSLAAGGVTDIEPTVLAKGLPYAQNVPGLIVPSDVITTLFLNHTEEVTRITIEPTEAFTIKASKSPGTYILTPNANAYGHVRITVTYASKQTQSIHYNIVKSGPTVLSDLGNFLATKSYFNDTWDPFNRAPSVISYDNSVSNFVTQDYRVWIAGLSDEAGAGSWLAACMKQAAQPNAKEVARLEAFVLDTLWGTIQVDSGSNMYGVRKSVFYYEKEGFHYDASIQWQPYGESWNKSQAFSTVRAYDYVHVSAAYWALYRVARAYPELVSRQDWSWYLNQSYQTVMKCTARSGMNEWVIPFANDGLMGETVWKQLLLDLGREQMNSEAALLEASMKARAIYWNSIAVPFGSEMAWDSTAEEGVYLWSSYFNLTTTANKSLNSVLGYMPTMAHWGWNGNARRYWDFLYGGKPGKTSRIERQIHHYGSGLNAQPLLEHYKTNPNAPNADYLLRVGFAGISGPLTNINSEGFASAAFHSWPDTLEWDPYSGDYGPNFVGLVMGSGCFITNDTLSGDEALVYGGNAVRSNANSITVKPRDPLRRRVYIAAMKLQVEIDAGAIEQVNVDFGKNQVVLSVVKKINDNASPARNAVVWLESYGSQDFEVLTKGLEVVRGGWQVSLSNGSGSVIIAGIEA